MHNALEHVLCCFPLLHGGGAAYLGVGVLSGVASAQQVEMLRRQFDELTAQMTVVEHCDERSGDRTHGSREINGTVSVETAPRGHESREVRVVRSWQRHRRLGFHVQRIRGYARSCLSSLAEHRETIFNSDDGQQTQKGVRKVVREVGNNGFRSFRTTVPDVWFVQNMTYKFSSKIEDVEDRLNEFLELVSRHDEANGTDPVPAQVNQACIISHTPEPLKTHVQLNVAKFGKL